MAGVQSIARDQAGNAIGQAVITVFERNTTTEASIFSDPEKTQVLSNPFQADNNGVFTFYADPGIYDIQMEKTGFNTVTIPDVELPITMSNEVDHGELQGLLDDDHPQYLLIDGSRAMTGTLQLPAMVGIGFAAIDVTSNLDMNSLDIANVGSIEVDNIFSSGPATKLNIDGNPVELGGNDWPQVEPGTDTGVPALDDDIAIKSYVDNQFFGRNMAAAQWKAADNSPNASLVRATSGAPDMLDWDDPAIDASVPTGSDFLTGADGEFVVPTGFEGIYQTNLHLFLETAALKGGALASMTSLFVEIKVNGVTKITQGPDPSYIGVVGTNPLITIAGLLVLAEADVVTSFLSQDSGATVAVQSGGVPDVGLSFFELIKVA